MRRLHILFVDNDAQTRQKIQQTLQEAFDVTCVASVAEAKALLASDQPPDLLISEVMFTQESGLDLCTYIRNGKEALHKLPIMLLTNRMTLRDKVLGFQAGADDYVVKPFEPRYLIARIKLLARIKRLESTGGRATRAVEPWRSPGATPFNDEESAQTIIEAPEV